jgi:hypothetical protein
MKKNSFKKWEPLSGLPEEMYLEGLHNDYEGFRLLLKSRGDQAKMLRITFDPVLAYRGIDEGDLISYQRFNEDDDLGRWAFFIVNSSDYLEWFNQSSQGIHEGEGVVHYAIYTPDDCLDILSAYPPDVEWLN